MATNHTEKYQLNQWVPTDPVLRADFNEDNAKIEAALAKLQEEKVPYDSVIMLGTEIGNIKKRLTALEEK